MYRSPFVLLIFLVNFCCIFGHPLRLIIKHLKVNGLFLICNGLGEKTFNSYQQGEACVLRVLINRINHKAAQRFQRRGLHCLLQLRLRLITAHFLRRFPVPPDCQTQKDNPQHQQREKFFEQVEKAGTFKQDVSHYFHEIVNRVEAIEPLRPFGHTFHRGENTAHQNKNHHKKETNKHYLLLCVGHC